jgi:hypothetical protein
MSNIRPLPAKDAQQLKAALDSIWPLYGYIINAGAEGCSQCNGHGRIGHGKTWVQCHFCRGNGWKGGANPFKRGSK